MSNNDAVTESDRRLRRKRPKEEAAAPIAPTSHQKKKIASDEPKQDEPTITITPITVSSKIVPKKMIAIKKKKVDEPAPPVEPDTESESESETLLSDSDDDDDSSAPGLLEQIFGKKLISGNDRWKKGLTPEEVQKYEYIFKDLAELELDVPKILRSNLSETEKARAIYVMLNYDSNSQQYEETARLIAGRKQNPIPIDQITKYDELEKKLSQQTGNRLALKYQIMDLQMPEKQLAVVWETYEMLQRLEESDSDYHKHFEWMLWILRMPWGKLSPKPILRDTSDLRVILSFMKEQLDRNVYGLSMVKEELLVFLMDRLLPRGVTPSQTQKKGGKILALEGSAGVGKTYIMKTVSRCLGIPFQSIAAGGCKDSSFWDGHSITYEGSVPGCIVKALRQAKVTDPIIYIDELDKLSEHDRAKDVTSILLHILDETQNSEFTDKYIGEIPFDLSNVMWVISINDRNRIDPILRDRLYILKVPDPTLKDKIEMSQQILIPDILSINDLTDEDVMFENETISHLISKTGGEKGVRSLKQLIEAVVKRVAYLKHTLVNLPTSSVYVAALMDAQRSLTSKSTPQAPQMLTVTAPVPVLTTAAERQQHKTAFAEQTSFYFPEFRLPLRVTVPVAEKLLAHYSVADDNSNYKRMFI